MLTFRPAGEADVPALVALVESAYRGDASRVGWTTEADLIEGQRTDPEEIRSAIGAPKRLILIAERDGELVSCCHVADQDGYGYFGLFAVVPGEQGGGVGRAVLAEAERIAHEDWGLGEMRLKVISLRVDLMDWYVRRGYRRTGELTPFPYGNLRLGLPTRDDLAFELLVKPLGQ